MLTIAALAFVLVAAHAAPYHGGYHNNNYHVGAHANYANYANGLRQKYVNHVAEKVGAGIGTADKYGVPGTYVGYHGHNDGYGYARGHGYANGYGHGHGYGVYPDYHNAHRQSYVNKVAESVGAGTGTYKEDGVPGTQLDKNRRHYH